MLFRDFNVSAANISRREKTSHSVNDPHGNIFQTTHHSLGTLNEFHQNETKSSGLTTEVQGIYSDTSGKESSAEDIIGLRSVESEKCISTGSDTAEELHTCVSDDSVSHHDDISQPNQDSLEKLTEPFGRSEGSDVHSDDQHQIPKETYLYLSAEECSPVFPEKGDANRRDKLQGKWATLLSSKIKEHLPECAFKANRVRKLTSRKQNSPFFPGKAVCTREFCSVNIVITIEQKPSLNEPVSMAIAFSGKQRHARKAAKRQLKEKNRVKNSHHSKE